MVSVEASPPSGSLNASPISIVEVWDIEEAKLTETFVTRWSPPNEEISSGPNPTIGVEADRSPASAIAMLVQLRQREGSRREKRPGFLHSPSPFKEETTPLPSCSVRALVTGVDFGGPSRSESSKSSGKGFMLSGSDDAKIRLWDLWKIEKSTVLSGLDSELERPTYRYLLQ
jgi:phosphoinositide-3-kinase regulatory subunit 4